MIITSGSTRTSTTWILPSRSTTSTSPESWRWTTSCESRRHQGCPDSSADSPMHHSCSFSLGCTFIPGHLWFDVVWFPPSVICPSAFAFHYQAIVIRFSSFGFRYSILAIQLCRPLLFRYANWFRFSVSHSVLHSSFALPRYMVDDVVAPSHRLVFCDE